MKLLLISVSSKKTRGGIATWTDRFLAHCGEHGISCDLVNTEVTGKRAEKGTAKRSVLDEFFRTKRIFHDLKCALKNSCYDAVHLNTSCGTFGLFRDYLTACRVKKNKVRLITHFHCDIPYWINNPVSRHFLGKLISLSDERLVLCESSRLYLKNVYHISSTEVPNFIDDSLVLAERKRIRENLDTVFFVGRVSKPKGAAEIYALAAEFPSLTFELVGEVSDEVASWEKSENIKLIGSLPHDEVIKRMDDADLFLFPSHSEGFSLALTEAMARGIPSIATDVGANRAMLKDGCGIIVKCGDVEQMTLAIQTMQSAEARSEMSRLAVETVRAEYTTDAVLALLKEIYEV